MNRRRLNPMALRTGIAFLAAITGCNALLQAANWPEPSTDGIEYFERTIRPILANACYNCHSSQAEKLKGDLLLDSWEGIRKGGTSGDAIIPGDPEKSPLVQSIRWQDKDFQMPPKEKLPDTILIELERWVKMGAPYPRHAPSARSDGSSEKKRDTGIAAARNLWQYKPPAKTPPPNAANPQWNRNPVDQFLAANWEKNGITPPPTASKQTLIRRATFDLTGLPPTPQEISDFVSDNTPGAWERVIERLLASPAYGERWGRHWLDVVRYSDTAGDSADYPVPEARLYRDYVIDSFNSDKPYDLFLKEQLAGDLLPHANEAQRREHITATGYIAISRRFGVNPEMNLTIDDTIDNVGKSMLGLTVACARCHDHKFDPISMRDYYALWGIFGSTKYPFPGSENVKRPLDFVTLSQSENKPDPSLLKQLEDLQQQKETLRKERIEAAQNPNDKRSNDDFRRAIQKLEKKIAEVSDKMPKSEMAFAVSESKPIDEPIHIRGDQFKKGPVAERGFLEVLGGQKLGKDLARKTSGRLQLAEWITSPSNPLTARVMVNRIWLHHFGKALAPSVNDWGKQGKPTKFPQLIDFLATRFVEDGYSIKAMHRLLMGSTAYQLASDSTESGLAHDPANELFWRFTRKRLDAEQLRDSILKVSGNLASERPGNHPFPPTEKWNWTQHAPFNDVYENNHRSVYQMQQRIKRHPFFGTFDGADTNASTGERPLSLTPLQALFLLNDKFTKSQSEILAERLLRESQNNAQRITLAYQLAYGRTPDPSELASISEFLDAYHQQHPQASDPQTERNSLAALARVIFSSNEFCFLD